MRAAVIAAAPAVSGCASVSVPLSTQIEAGVGAGGVALTALMAVATDRAIRCGLIGACILAWGWAS